MTGKIGTLYFTMGKAKRILLFNDAFISYVISFEIVSATKDSTLL